WSRTAEHTNHEVLQVFTGKEYQHLVKAYLARFEVIWDEGREHLPQFMKRLKAKKGTKDYRRFLPAHFKTMAINGTEMRRIRTVFSSAGFFRRKKDARPAWDFWTWDREKKVGTNDWPPFPHKPFFDLEQLVITEVCFNPKNQASGEYIELYNGSAKVIDLKGYIVSDGDATDTVTAHGKRSTKLGPGKVALIIDPDFDKDFPLPRGVVVVTVGNGSIGNGLTAEDLVTIAAPDKPTKAVDSCELSLKANKGNAILRKSHLIPTSPDNWEVKKATPGKMAVLQ
ncbi:MAG: lamin tail domain-containing protein, partial [Planctomycetota bacterium]